MFIEFILTTVLTIVGGLLGGVLPEDSGAPGLAGTVGGFVPWFAWLDSWAPIHEAFDLAILSVQISVVVGGIYFATWILTKLHILGGSS